MVQAKNNAIKKDENKVPTSAKPTIIQPNKLLSKDLAILVSSPGASPTSIEDEVLALRARNKILTQALQSIKETAEKEVQKHYDLVWFARHKSRYPNSEARKRIEASDDFKEDLEKLSSMDADYHHGVHAGLLAASRMFGKQADILHVNKLEEVSDEFLKVAAQHEQKVEEAKEEFPKVEVAPVPHQ